MSVLEYKERERDGMVRMSFANYREMEMEIVDNANEKLIPMLVDMMLESQKMKKRVNAHANTLFKTTNIQLWCVEEELYQWSKRVI